jgi:serine/threonine protein kinase
VGRSPSRKRSRSDGTLPPRLLGLKRTSYTATSNPKTFFCLTATGVSPISVSRAMRKRRPARTPGKYAQTDQYAAPERWRHERATTAVDVYSLGVIAFEMLHGQRPFLGPDYRHQHLHEDPPHLHEVPVALGALVDECLMKAPQGVRLRPTSFFVWSGPRRASRHLASRSSNKPTRPRSADARSQRGKGRSP